MDKFEKLLSEISQREECSQCKESKECQQKQEGPALPREFEIIVTYEEGKEEEAKVVQGRSEAGAYALLFAVGKLLGELTDVDGDKIGCELVKAAIKIVAKQAMDNIFEDLKELL